MHARAINTEQFDENITQHNSHRYHFQHRAEEGNNCPWKTDGISKGEIYQGIEEGKKHRELKLLLAQTLASLPDWQVDLTTIDKYFLFSVDRRQRGKPDVHAFYKGQEVVFEIQLRSETPATIVRRKKLYKESGRQLIWLSAQNSDIVGENYRDQCIDIKQVQKDIAFSNRGNLFFFNEELAKQSFDNGTLQIEVWIWTPRLDNQQINYLWEHKNIGFEQLNYSEGETFFVDFNALDAEIKKELREKGQHQVLAALTKIKPHHFEDFMRMTKEYWPTVDYELDSDWLNKLFNRYDIQRQIMLKDKVLAFFRSDPWRNKSNDTQWQLLVDAVKDMDYGINSRMALHVIEKILLILGHHLSDYLNPAKSSFVQSTHYFYDRESLYQYRYLCDKAINVSPYRQQILTHRTMKERLTRPYPQVAQDQSLHRFFEWFLTPLPPL